MMPPRQILFADDDVLTQWIITDVLSNAGFGVVNACRGAEVMALLDGSNEFDLLLTEMDLPDHIDGRRLADHWATLLPGRPVVYSGRQHASTSRMLRQNEYFIEKPFEAAKLLQLVDWALEDAMIRPIQPAAIGFRPHVH